MVLINTITKPVLSFTVVLVEVAKEEIMKVKSVMEENIAQVLERGEKLDELQLKAEQLNVEARRFERRAPVKHVVVSP